eukprot:5071528-Prymnesium_polylepis.1
MRLPAFSAAPTASLWWTDRELPLKLLPVRAIVHHGGLHAGVSDARRPSQTGQTEGLASLSGSGKAAMLHARGLPLHVQARCASCA